VGKKKKKRSVTKKKKGKKGGSQAKKNWAPKAVSEGKEKRGTSRERK